MSEPVAADEKKPPVEYVFTTDLPEMFDQLGISLLITTYQAQFVMALSSRTRGMTMTLRHFERPTGLAVQGNRMALCTRRQIWTFRATGELRDESGVVQPYDLCYAPRSSHVTGDLSVHDAAWVGDELLFLNTRFSCLCTLNPDWSFVPLWKPPFVSAIVPEDRCHLNGLAVDAGAPRYVTILGESDTREGWRENKATGGIVMRLPDRLDLHASGSGAGEVVARGLSMPHSPRLHDGQLYVLDSGRGELQTVDASSGARSTVTRLPGYLRGLDFHGRYAFVGLCKMREHREFGGVPIEAMKDQLKCAVYVIDMATGQTLGFIEFTRGIEELFDVHVVPVRKLHIFGMEDDAASGLFIVPPVPAPSASLPPPPSQSPVRPKLTVVPDPGS